MYYVYEREHGGDVNVWFARNTYELCETAQFFAAGLGLEVNGLAGVDEVARAWSQFFAAHRIYGSAEAVRAGIARGEVCETGKALLLHWVNTHDAARPFVRVDNRLVLQ